jgi:glycosyl hydrolase family 26
MTHRAMTQSTDQHHTHSQARPDHLSPSRGPIGRRTAAGAAVLSMAAFSLVAAPGSSFAAAPSPASAVAGTAVVASAPAAMSAAAAAPAATKRNVTATQRLLGTPPSRGAWYSGVWTGGFASSSRTNAFGSWRGRTVDSATSYPSYGSWQSIADSRWKITTFSGVRGRLNFGLALLPTDGSGTLAQVAAGKYDWVFRQVALNLKQSGRGNSIVRIGFEANGWWFPWGANTSKAAAYRAAFRHVSVLLKKTAPKLLVDFNLGCGVGLQGSSDRLAGLKSLYPGDKYVDIVGCDHYDAWTTKATNAATWKASVKPRWGVGLADLTAFARAHHKGFSVPEWGLTAKSQGGAGDNPYFISKMRSFFNANRDVLVLENYFNEAGTTLDSSIWEVVQNPRAAAMYRALW